MSRRYFIITLFILSFLWFVLLPSKSVFADDVLPSANPLPLITPTVFSLPTTIPTTTSSPIMDVSPTPSATVTPSDIPSFSPSSTPIPSVTPVPSSSPSASSSPTSSPSASPQAIGGTGGDTNKPQEKPEVENNASQKSAETEQIAQETKVIDKVVNPPKVLGISGEDIKRTVRLIINPFKGSSDLKNSTDIYESANTLTPESTSILLGISGFSSLGGLITLNIHKIQEYISNIFVNTFSKSGR